MGFKLFDVSLCTQGICLACGGTGKIRAKRKAAVLGCLPIVYDEVTIRCITCNGTGYTCTGTSSTSTAPRSRRTEK